jgi:hypothetical protein
VLAAGVARGKEPRVLDDALGPVDGPRCVCRKSRRAQQRTPKRLSVRAERTFSRGLTRLRNVSAPGALEKGLGGMAKKVSDFFIERLKAWGVKRIYGYPGDGINGVLGALQRRGP